MKKHIKLVIYFEGTGILPRHERIGHYFAIPAARKRLNKQKDEA